MRQLNNKHFDTIEGASARQGEVVSSASRPLVSQQKDETMKHIKRIENKVNKMIDKFINDWNEEMVKDSENMKKLYPDTDWTHKEETRESLGIIIHFHEDGDVAMDGELFSAFIGQSEWNLYDEITENITSYLYGKNYDYEGFGVFKYFGAEGGK
jgi:hypothetical protein